MFVGVGVALNLGGGGFLKVLINKFCYYYFDLKGGDESK